MATLQITNLNDDYKKAFDLLKAQRCMTSEKFMRVLLRTYLDIQESCNSSYALEINKMLDDNNADKRRF